MSPHTYKQNHAAAEAILACTFNELRAISEEMIAIGISVQDGPEILCLMERLVEWASNVGGESIDD